MVILPQQEREGPARHPRGDPQADQARPRRLDGPGPRGRPAAQAEGHRRSDPRPGRRPREGRAGRRPGATPRLPGRPAAGRRARGLRFGRGSRPVPPHARPGEQAAPGEEGRAMEYRDYYAVARGAADGDARPRSRRPTASSPGSTTRTETRRRRGRAPLQGDQRGARGPLRSPEAAALRRARAPTGRTPTRTGAGRVATRSGRAGPSRASAGGRAGAADPGVRFEFSGDAGNFSDFFRTFFAGGMDGYRGNRGPDGPRAARAPAAAAGSSKTTRRVPRAPGRPSTSSWPASGSAVVDAAEAARRGAGCPLRHEGRRPHDRERRSTRPPEAAVEVTLEEAFSGATRLVEVDGRRLEVKIPAGVETGSRIRLRGQGGGDGRRRARPGPRRDAWRRTRSSRARARTWPASSPVTLREALLGAEVPGARPCAAAAAPQDPGRDAARPR